MASFRSKHGGAGTSVPGPDRELVLRAPKVLLHEHLDGGLRPETVVELARECRLRGLAHDDPERAGRVVRARAPRAASLGLYLEGFRTRSR